MNVKIPLALVVLSLLGCQAASPAASPPTLAGHSSPDPVSRWEYKVVGFPDNYEVSKKLGSGGDGEQLLNSLGKDGWELVALHPFAFVLKRPLKQ